MAERATIARPYAKAAFEYARDANATAAWSLGLKVAAEIVADQRVTPLTKSPRLGAADLVSLIADVAGANLNAPMQNFVRILAENHRLLLLPEIAAHYEALRSEVENTVDVEVISAVADFNPQIPASCQSLSLAYMPAGPSPLSAILRRPWHTPQNRSAPVPGRTPA